MTEEDRIEELENELSELQDANADLAREIEDLKIENKVLRDRIGTAVSEIEVTLRGLDR